MTHYETKACIENFKKGTIHTMTYQKSLKTRKGITDVVTKTTKMQVRLGVRYDNITAVKEARNDGSLPVTNSGLASSLEWIDGNFIRNTKTGNIMLRVAYANGNKTVSEYRLNGKIVDKAEIEPLCLKSEFSVSDSAPTVINIGVEKIIEIH